MTPMNPPGAPMGPGFAEPPPAPFNAREALNLPSVLLLVVGALGLFAELSSVIGFTAGPQMVEPLLKLAPNLPPELKQQLGDAFKPTALNLGMTLLGLLANGVVLFGAWQLRQLKQWSLGLTAAILAMIPCFTSCCCLIGLPAGIWATVLLLKPEVKAQFG